jgi:hypothetical protein
VVGVGLGTGPEADRARADLHALAGDDWLVRLVSGVKSNLVRLAWGSEITTEPAEPSEALAMLVSEPNSSSRDLTDSELAQRSRWMVKADIGSAVGLIGVVAVVRRFWRPLHEQWRRHHPSVAAGQQPDRPYSRRPHAFAGIRSPTRDRTALLRPH